MSKHGRVMWLLVFLASGAFGQAGAQFTTAPQGVHSIAQADPSSPTGVTCTQVSQGAPFDPIEICGPNPVFAFCNGTEINAYYGVVPPEPYEAFVVIVPAMSCLTFNPTWLANTEIIINSLPSAKLVDC